MNETEFVDGNPNFPMIAVVGCGSWGRNLVRNFGHLRALRRIVDVDESRLQEFTKLYPGVNASRHIEDALADQKVRGVVLSTPAATHYDLAKQVLESGKHVFVEKPLALRYSQGIELVELARGRNLLLMVGHVLEYHPAVLALKELIDRGELGRLRYLYSNRLNLGKVRKEENILWSFAPHDISVICRLVGGEPCWVSAQGTSYLQPGVVDVTVTNFGFECGVSGHVFVSWLHPFKEQKLVVIGERKMAVFDDMVREGKLKIYDKGIEWEEGQPVARHAEETTLFFDETEPLLLECAHFLTCLREQKQPRTDGSSALKVLKVLEASQCSLEHSGAPVQLINFEGR